jgi:hypothetical protein
LFQLRAVKIGEVLKRKMYSCGREYCLESGAMEYVLLLLREWAAKQFAR